MVIDCFLFFKEFDMLELRLHILDKFVDKFVLCESRTTFNNKPKPLFFQENFKRFEKYKDKIIHVIVDDEKFNKKEYNKKNVRKHNNAMSIEWFQRDYATFILNNFKDTDIVIAGDCDEIPNLKFLESCILNPKDMRDYNAITSLEFNYYLNWYCEHHEETYINTISTNKVAKELGLCGCRWKRKTDPSFVVKGGLHLNNIMNDEDLKQKLFSFAHSKDLTLEQIKEMKESKRSPYGKKIKILSKKDCIDIYGEEIVEKFFYLFSF
jgi:beta-1,4-mannosyl-glycoprotein beta-1,4-N-acetylglucosaminyltransferase